MMIDDRYFFFIIIIIAVNEEYNNKTTYYTFYYYHLTWLWSIFSLHDDSDVHHIGEESNSTLALKFVYFDLDH